MKNIFRNKPVVFSVIALGLTLVLYLFGLKETFIPALTLVLALVLPLPKIFSSLLARLVVSFMLIYSLLQIAAAVKFLVFPSSGFNASAILTTLLAMLIILGLGGRERIKPSSWLAKSDIAAGGVALIFIVPFLILGMGTKGILRIADIGGIQAIDAPNHFAIIAEMAQSEHLTYKVGNYYPKGFHSATAFVQQSLHINQATLSWTTNSRLFIGQYLLFGAILAFALFYLCRMLLDIINPKLNKTSNWLIVLSLGPALTLFYLLPFVYDGFLNYFYVSAVIALALVFVHEYYELNAKQVIAKAAQHQLFAPGSRWFLIGYLLLMYGVGMSWPLLIPPLLLIPAYYIITTKMSVSKMIQQLLRVENIILLIAVLIQLIPVYFQLKYSSGSTAQGINLLGGIRTFHFGVLIVGFLMVVYFSMSNQTNEAFKKFVNSVFLPFYLLLGALVAVQYFTTGELRYYAIKSGYLIEILILTTVVAWLIAQYANSRLHKMEYFLMVPLIPLIAIMLLTGLTGNPLANTRDLFRTYSHELKPTYFDQDVQAFTSLGERGAIKHFNTTLLHYDFAQQKFFAHMQIPFWANMMTYTGAPQDNEALNCSGAIYANLLFGNFSVNDQAQLEVEIRHCAMLAKQVGEKYYIVTDSASASIVKSVYGNVAVIVQ